MNVFVVTAGQCGSRVVAEALARLGFELPDVNPENFDNVILGDLENRYLRELDHKRYVLDYINRFDNSIFKSLTLLRHVDELEGAVVFVYRHPYQWKMATTKVAEERKLKKYRTYNWWSDYHTYMLLWHQKLGCPLIDFSMDFEEDMTRNFGDCLSHYDPSKVNITATKDAFKLPMQIYGKLTECRKSMASIIQTPNTQRT